MGDVPVAATILPPAVVVVTDWGHTAPDPVASAPNPARPAADVAGHADDSLEHRRLGRSEVGVVGEPRDEQGLPQSFGGVDRERPAVARGPATAVGTEDLVPQHVDDRPVHDLAVQGGGDADGHDRQVVQEVHGPVDGVDDPPHVAGAGVVVLSNLLEGEDAA